MENPNKIQRYSIPNLYHFSDIFLFKTNANKSTKDRVFFVFFGFDGQFAKIVPSKAHFYN